MNIQKYRNLINEYAEIQRKLLDLKPNSSDQDIQEFINQIPQNLLTQKDSLMMICQLFAHYAKYTSPLIRGNAIKLFEKIMSTIKKLLQDQSSFFYKVFGGLFYFKLIMYEENLLTIDYLIMSILRYKSSLEAEYFLPEIIKERPEVFDKEIKYLIKCPYTDEYIQKLIEKRQKHIQWIRTSCDFHDPLYKEIETDKLRLSIKTDDFDTFQKILSNLNLSVNSKISESIFDNYFEIPREIYLIELVINYNAINIFKFMIMNDVKISEELNFAAISLRNTEMIHLIESEMNEKFVKNSLFNAIGCWNTDMLEYSIDHSEFNFLDNGEVTSEYDEVMLKIVLSTFLTNNFIFMETFLLPFLEKNERFINENFNDIALLSIVDLSCFYFSEFLKDPKIDINYKSKYYNNMTFLGNSIIESNVKAIETLFQFPNLDINSVAVGSFSGFQCACKYFSEMKVVDLFLKNPSLNIKYIDERFHLNAFGISVAFGNFYFLQKILDIKFFSNICSSTLQSFCVWNHHFYLFKILTKKLFEIKHVENPDIYKQRIIIELQRTGKYKQEYEEIIMQICNEILNK